MKHTSNPIEFGLTFGEVQLRHLKRLPMQKRFDAWSEITGEWSDGAAFAFAQELGIDFERIKTGNTR